MDNFKENIKNTFMTCFYFDLPHKPRLLPELDRICINRLKLYKLMLEATNKFRPSSEEWEEYVLNEIFKAELVEFLALLDTDKFKEHKTQPLEPALENYFIDDETGHFCIALIASKSEEMKRLFLKLELQWFQLKFNLNVPERRVIAYLKQGITREGAPQLSSKDETLSIKDTLISFYDLDFEKGIPPIFKVPCEKFPNLFNKRNAVIKNGFIYFPKKKKYISLFVQHIIERKWRNKVKNLSSYWSMPNRDERMVIMVETFTPEMKRLTNYTGEFEEGTLTLEKIDDHSDILFPLCMSEMHRLLKEEQHLTHFARRQYTLFLKHAGMCYEDAIELFESEFTNRMSEEDFRKQKYHYYFSHFYGKVGGKIDYSALSCEEIMENPPNGKQKHGCPFAYSTDAQLTKMLEMRHVNKPNISEILGHKNNQRYQQACCVYFCNKLEPTIESVPSPNYYYACALNTQIADIEDIFE